MVILAAIMLSLITASIKATSSYVTEIQALELTDKITDLIHSQSITLDLIYYENPFYQDNLHRAQAEGATKPGKIVTDLVQILQNGISITAIGSLILSFSPIAGVILVCSAIPALVTRLWNSHRMYTLNVEQTELNRKSQYYHFLLTHTYYAKENRVFSLGSFFRELYNSVRTLIRHSRLQVSRSRAFWEIITQGLVAISIFGTFTVIALMTLNGNITLGDMVMYFMGFQMCMNYLQSIISSLTMLYDDHLFIRDFFQFLDLKPDISAPEKPEALPNGKIEEIQVKSLSFTYPDAHKPALHDISFTIRRGEVIAFVGENGAGKSTLIKLFCRLYLPGSGTITADGIDINQLDPVFWRRRLSVLFQDYIRYQLTVEENIRVGDIEGCHESGRVKQAAEKAGADPFIQKLPQQYQTMLGKFFSGGQDLSIGEWQKIALSRAFFRDAEFILLDEPASSLDAKAEAQIFQKFREIIQNKTAIIISHRFSTVRIADHIYMIEEGKIVEHGSHTDLMIHNGRYAEMYRSQADLYE